MHKKLSITLLLLLYSSFLLHAQVGIEIGLRLVPQSTWLYQFTSNNNHDNTFSERINLAYGLNSTLYLADNLGIQSGVLVSTQGQRYDATQNISKKQLSYVKIPILLQLNSSRQASLSVVGALGVQWHKLLVANHLDLTNTPISIPDSLGYTTIDLYHKTGWDILGNIGLLVNLSDRSNLKLLFRADYTPIGIENTDFTYTVSGREEPYYPNNFVPSHHFTAGIQFEINYLIGP